MTTQVNKNVTTISTLNGVVVIFLFDFKTKHRTWAWFKLMQGSGQLFKSFQGLRFAKVMGSGEGGGFGLRPSSTHQGMILLFDEIEHASQCIKSLEITEYRDKTREFWQGMLLVNSCRGAWDSQNWQSQGADLDTLSHDELTPYTASLTRASVKATKALEFWRFSPAAQADLKTAQGCELAVGLGEAPLVRQCTFSIWQNDQSMVNYARQGAHLKAIAAAQKFDFFSESMFVRMKVLHMFGQWCGKCFDTNASAIKPYALNL